MEMRLAKLNWKEGEGYTYRKEIFSVPLIFLKKRRRRAISLIQCSTRAVLFFKVLPYAGTAEHLSVIGGVYSLFLSTFSLPFAHHVWESPAGGRSHILQSGSCTQSILIGGDRERHKTEVES